MIQRFALAAAAATALAAPAWAAPLNLPVDDPTIVFGQTSLTYLSTSGGGDLSTFGAPATSSSGIALGGPTVLGLGVGFDPLDPVATTDGGFDIFDGNALLLLGEVKAVGFDTDQIEIWMDAVAGSAVDEFERGALVTIDFIDALGSSPFAALSDRTTYRARVTVEAVVIPVPAALPLLLAGLGALAVARRRG